MDHGVKKQSRVVFCSQFEFLKQESCSRKKLQLFLLLQNKNQYKSVLPVQGIRF